MSYEAVGDYLSKTNRSPGQKVSSSSTFLLQQIAKEEKTKEQKSSSSPEEISVERVEQIPKKLFGEEVNKEIDYVKDLLKMHVEEESDVAGTSGFPSQFKQILQYLRERSERTLHLQFPHWFLPHYLKDMKLSSNY